MKREMEREVETQLHNKLAATCLDTSKNVRMEAQTLSMDVSVLGKSGGPLPKEKIYKTFLLFHLILSPEPFA